MSLLQTLLDEIEREATEKSAVVMRDIAIFEAAHALADRLEAAGLRPFVSPYFHFTPTRIGLHTYEWHEPALRAALEAIGIMPIDTAGRMDVAENVEVSFRTAREALQKAA